MTKRTQILEKKPKAESGEKTMKPQMNTDWSFQHVPTSSVCIRAIRGEFLLYTVLPNEPKCEKTTIVFAGG
jgi:hypothetical protein